jgi:SAM-dependent methyltransferase
MLRRVDVGGCVLDAGAGTGVVARAALRHGARRAVLCDLAPGMLRASGLPAVAGDVARLPFRDGSFDLAAGGFLLSHVVDPATALRELGRVAVRVAASAFRSGWTHPAKTAVDELLAAEGYAPPAWHRRLKDVGEPAVADAGRLATVAQRAGLAEVVVHELQVDTAVREPGELVDWRLGMAHVAPFVAALPAVRRDALRAAAVSTLRGVEPLEVPMLVLTACRPAQRH